MTAPLPLQPLAVTTDVVIFTIRDQRLQVLLVRRRREPYADSWEFPGGYVNQGENLEDSAIRTLAQRTGLSGVYLEQLYTFGDPGRDPRQRVISVAYYALVPAERTNDVIRGNTETVDCFPVDELPPLAFDHGSIVTLAKQRLSAKLAYSTIAFQFMPEEFTLGDLQTVYEIIADQSLDKRNFRKHVLAIGQIEETGEVRRIGKHRPARLYRAKHPGQVAIIR